MLSYIKNTLYILCFTLLVSSCLPDDSSQNYAYPYSPVTEISIEDTISSTDTIIVTHLGFTPCDLLYNEISYFQKTDSGFVYYLRVATPVDKEECEYRSTPLTAKLFIPDTYNKNEINYFYFWQNTLEDGTQVFIKDSTFIE